MVGAVLPATLVALAVVPALGLRSRLPDPMATHWGLSGSANGSMPVSAFVAGVVLFSLVPAAVAMTVSRRRPAAPGEITPWLAGATFVLGLTALLAPMMVAANLDAADWRRADLALGAPLVAAAGASVLAALCARLALRLETAVPTPAEELPSAGLRATERAAWVGGASSRGMGLVTVACLGAAGVGLLLAGAAVWVPLLVCGAVSQAFTSVRVSVDATGVRIAYGWLRRPSTRIGIDSVRRATAIDVKPSAWGGWGYRGSLRLNGRAAVVVRAGEGLRLDLREGRVFLVTVDGAATPAGVLNDALRALGRLDRA